MRKKRVIRLHYYMVKGSATLEDYDLRYHYGSPWMVAMVNVGQNYSHCVLFKWLLFTWSNEKSQRNRVFQNKVYTLVSRQLQLSVTAPSRLYNFTTFKRKRPSTKISNAFKIAEIYHSCLSRAILKITWFSLKKKNERPVVALHQKLKVQLILRCLL